jgi:tetratricopeptide (TPR) repeat protein
MEQEFGNVRAAFAWSLAAGDIDPALRLVGIHRFWMSLQGHREEGLAWVNEALSRPGNADPSLRARALRQAGEFRRVEGDLDGARWYLEQAVSIQRELSDPAALGEILYVLGLVESATGRTEQAHEAIVESIAIATAVGGRQQLGERLAQLGEITYDQGVPERARPLLEDALRLARETGDSHTVADALRVLGMIARDDGHSSEARSFLGEAVALQREISDWTCTSVSLSVLADQALRERDPAQARALFAESLELQRNMGPHWYRAVDCLWGLAATAAAEGRLVRATRLLGAEERLRREARVPFRLARPERHDAVLQYVRNRMEEAAFISAWREGLAMGREEALALALTDDEPRAPTET